jgi:hypothetical protein
MRDDLPGTRATDVDELLHRLQPPADPTSAWDDTARHAVLATILAEDQTTPPPFPTGWARLSRLRRGDFAARHVNRTSLRCGHPPSRAHHPSLAATIDECTR